MRAERFPFLPFIGKDVIHLMILLDSFKEVRVFVSFKLVMPLIRPFRWHGGEKSLEADAQENGKKGIKDSK